jgi:transcriptional regulator with XRE-family HTH domain
MVCVGLGKKIEKLKKDGLSQHKIAKKLGIAQSTVSDYLKSIGVPSDQSRTKKAIDAKADYDTERRLSLNNKFFIKIEKMLDEAKTPNDLRALATPYGVASDKRALLEGSPNANISVSDQSIDERLEALAIRRAERKAAADQ